MLEANVDWVLKLLQFQVNYDKNGCSHNLHCMVKFHILLWQYAFLKFYIYRYICYFTMKIQTIQYVHGYKLYFTMLLLFKISMHELFYLALCKLSYHHIMLSVKAVGYCIFFWSFLWNFTNSFAFGRNLENSPILKVWW